MGVGVAGSVFAIGSRPDTDGSSSGLMSSVSLNLRGPRFMLFFFSSKIVIAIDVSGMGDCQQQL